MAKIVINLTGSNVVVSDVGNKTILPTGYTVPASEYALWKKSDLMVSLIGAGTLAMSDGSGALSKSQSIDLLHSLQTKQEIDFDASLKDADRLKVVVLTENHGSSHENNGSDEINVDGLSGVLNQAQHPIPAECVSAMGVLGDSNPLNHNRFNQSEISALPESQLNLDNPTHSNANDPTTAQKQAMDAANSPNTGNPFLTQTAASAAYSTTSHTHAELPTVDEKAAMPGGSPSSGNRFATMSDLNASSGLPIFINFSAITGTYSGGEIIKLLDDEVIGPDTYQAGWYEYVGGFSGTHGSAWLFHPTSEDHNHIWSQINKSGSLLSDLGDIPAYPNDGQNYYLNENNGVLTWNSVNQAVNRSIKIDLVYSGSSSGNWLRFSDKDIKTHESPWCPPFNCRVREVIFSHRKDGSIGQTWRVKAFEKDLSTSGNILNSNTLAWSVESSVGPNLLYNNRDGKTWGYDASSENSVMSRGIGYGFVFERITGSITLDDLHVEVMLEEI